jgi:flagellar biosynthesis chaperone FliJ
MSDEWSGERLYTISQRRELALRTNEHAIVAKGGSREWLHAYREDVDYLLKHIAQLEDQVGTLEFGVDALKAQLAEAEREIERLYDQVLGLTDAD